MTVNRRSNRIDDLLANVGLPRQIPYLLLVLLGQLDDIFVSETADIVCLNDCREHREAMLHVSEIVESIDVDTGDLDLITRSSTIDLIVQDIHFLLSGNSSWWYSARGLLNRHLLVVAIHSVNFIHGERPVTLANDALTQERFALMSVRVVDRSLDVSTATSVEDLRVLGEDTCAFCHNTPDLDE